MSAEGVSFLIDKGLPTILLFLLMMAIGAIVILYKGRLSDWKEVGETLRNFTGTIRDWIAANEPRTRALEANVRALELLTAELTQLRNEVTQLRGAFEDRAGEAIKSNRDMREVVLALKEQIVAIYNRCARGV